MGIEKTWLLARDSVYQINMKCGHDCGQAVHHMLGVPLNATPKKRHYIMMYHADLGK